MPQLGFTEFFVGLTYVVAMGTALFFLDDLFTDAIALIKRLRPREISPHVLKRMQRAPQKHIAILIANWKEADVVGAVVRRNIRSVDYQNYRFFLGVYPNDTTTWMAAKELEKLFPEKVGVVVNSQSGPTSKGQMLNEVARQVLASEDRALKKTDFFLMLDSEDILHPQVLTLLNYYSYEADFLQIPVFPLDASRNSLLRGIYTDEFSEIHTKDLLVQQCLGKAIPAVGVRTGLSRELVVDLRLRQEGSIFKSNTLVEDYHVGTRAKLMGFRTQFICAQLVLENGRREFIATRKFFPANFMASVRQKSRWILGVSYQDVERSFSMREHKRLLSSVLTVLWLVVLSTVTFFLLVRGALPAGFKNRFLVGFLIFNMAAVIFRITQRMRFVHRVSGSSQIWMVPIRWLMANVINTIAYCRAHVTYRQSQRTGAQPASTSESKIEVQSQ